MSNFKIGVILESFRKSYLESLDLAASLKVDGIQMYATDGELSPDNLKGTQRVEFLKEIKARNLQVSAVVGDFGIPFYEVERNKTIVERSKRILDLAKDMETNIVTTHIGTVPEGDQTDRYKIMQQACFELSEYANSLDAHFAIETGPEPAARLKKFLDQLPSNGVAVNYDPANLAMVTKDDPVTGVHTLQDYIVHTHAKDGKPLFEEQITNPNEPWIELPLGEGAVDFPAYIRALEDIGYHGFLTIEREVGANPIEDIGHAVSYLNNLVGEK